MLIQGTLDNANNVVIPSNPLVWIDDGAGGGGAGGQVEVTNFPATQAVSGSVAVTNLPTTQTISGSISVTNFPATQPVSGTVTATGPITNAQMTAITGTAAQTAITIDPTAAGQTMLALLRGILSEMKAQTILLEAIRDNTATGV